MFLSSTLLLSLSFSLFGTTTHAHPLDPPSLATTNTTTSPSSIFTNLPPSLEKRAHYGWLSSYAPSDTTCSGGWGGARPKVYGDCIKFSPVSDNVGINWGTWPHSFDALDAFTDENCKHKAGKTIRAPKKGMGCVSVKAQAAKTGGKWMSVKYHDTNYE